ncbi:MAG TPA: guanylate kinase [Pyrinomonadaceae bacterium]|nr:guanylate kinase [Pyrinomonadaceae bacterium]
MTGSLIIITSPSGGGKGTLIAELMKTGIGVAYSVSYTTRPRRQAEEDGREYTFISVPEFERLIKEDEFLEYARVHDNYYGTSRSRVDTLVRGGEDVILEIDVQGAENVLKIRPDAVSIFILPPSFEALADRLRARNTETQSQLELRLRNSLYEVIRYTEFTYVVVNDNVADAVGKLEAIILAERQRRTRQDDAIRVILDSFEASKTLVSEEKGS